jgi:stage IV sporulation protein FB
MRLFKAFGTEVILDRTWFISVGALCILTYIISGLTSVTGLLIFISILFASVIAHEFAHIAVGRLFGIRVPRVVLHIFGGAALFPMIPLGWTELWIAVIGPAFSLSVAAICKYILLPMVVLNAAPTERVIYILLDTCMWCNLVLGLFNLLPIFPMDGGRIVRGLLFAYSKKPVWSTKVVVYGGWIVGPVAMYCLSGGLWMAIVFGLVMLTGHNELQSVQKRYNG